MKNTFVAFEAKWRLFLTFGACSCGGGGGGTRASYTSERVGERPRCGVPVVVFVPSLDGESKDLRHAVRSVSSAVPVPFVAHVCYKKCGLWLPAAGPGGPHTPGFPPRILLSLCPACSPGRFLAY